MNQAEMLRKKCWQTEGNCRWWKGEKREEKKKQFSRGIESPGSMLNPSSAKSFYSLWHHYISMTSQALANSDRGVMRIVGITELMLLPRLSPFSLTHYATLYLRMSLRLSKPLAPSSFLFFFFPSPLMLSLLKLSVVALYFRFISSCLWLVLN